ncbi:MAG: Tim44 domain-containing protein [Pseudomonadota bacterium]|jgi:predicted lipid-binding transport protein (Tim44 family)|uniref:Tim44 domain-containing protein n=1 Tax=Methyloversatilis discipulorum TaxID=1119528 RepID=UPI000371140E|nr:TIM44-like domain-containing protein [Methyloversatilis discipulorum]
MKNFLCALCVAVVGLGGAMHDAEAAKRMGGGKSFGSQRDSTTMQRDATPTSPTQNATTAQRQAQPAAPAAAQPAKRSWMGPLAGLAAGIGLAALASHLGFGEEMASFMMIALLVMVALFVWRMFAARRNAPQQQGMQYAGATAGPGTAPQRFEAVAPVAASAPAAAASAGNIPADFDVEGFLRQAKLNFVRLQAANDKGDVEDIRQFTSPEVFAEIRMQLQERGGETQHIDIVQLDAALLDLVTENDQYIASVRFSGLLREEVTAAPAPFDEVWHLAKPVSGNRGWVIAGIQQLQ